MRFSLFLLIMLSVSQPAFAVQTDWMSNIPDRASLSSINIPGTHNSGALHEPILGTAKCQSMSLQEQLESGTRFFDIRCRHSKDRFEIYHGLVSQNLSFTEVIETFKTFLQNHPSETIVTSIKQEYKPTQNTRPFIQTLQSYLDQAESVWYVKEAIPTIGDTRGKIVLLRRFESKKPLGIPATDWKSDGFHKADNVFIQDHYSLPDANTKWEVIKKAFSFSTAEAPDNRLHLHYTSGFTTRQFGLPDILAISDSINERLLDYLKTPPHKHHGFIVVDFMTPELAKSIYQMNFPKNNSLQKPDGCSLPD